MYRKCRSCKYCRVQTYDVPNEGIWFTESCVRKIRIKPLCRKYKEKDARQKKDSLYKNLGKGNGISLFGTSVMLVTFLFFYLLVHVFIIGHKSSSIQQAIDNVSDSVAVYMATDGEDYNDASTKTSEVVSSIYNETDIDLGIVTVDPGALDDHVVTVASSSDYNGISFYRASSTYFTPGSGLREKIVSYAMMWVGVTPYENPPRGYTDEFLTIGTDCSGFLHTIFSKFGIYVPSGSDAYQYMAARVISIQQAQPGDILVYGNGQHVVLYAGNGFVVNCGGGGPGGRATYEPYTYRSDLTRVISVID